MRLKVTLLFLLITSFVFSQRVCNDLYGKKFTKEQLTSDLDFIKEKIINAHANPFTEISKQDFDKKFLEIRNSLKEGMTQQQFYYLSKPLIVTLNDEHSAMGDFCVTDSIKNNLKVLPLKFKYENGKMLLSENYSDDNLTIGDEVISLNNMPINEVLENCAKTIPGAKEERIPIVVDRFWVVINKFCYFITDNYNFKFASGKQQTVKSIPLSEFGKKYSQKNSQNQQKEFKALEYQKIKKIGYINVNSFSDRLYSPEIWKKKFDSIFTQIKKDNVKKLVIDVSDNGGGNSALGDLLITYFSDKPYKTYQGTWKKSQEYSDFLKTMGKTYDDYEKIKNGENLPMISHIITPNNNPLKFKGKTYVVVGKNTFSSAMMFAVTILDNKLAKVVGEIPDKGHPNHFGELIKFTTPNTNLDFLFGVKEWIRPAGKIEPNKLIPQKIIELKDKTKEQIIQEL
ncbi:S41 family peptidase [Empedobacter falsenii]|uniref:Tail specific protease domain-containing protein n=1 Tax=Empedobacter falsenii TaxID=343874 RepID=A0A3R8SJC9_9FLAO|nr:S41 family peptidase [Empedobacter falsenii]RRT86248.1 hypothetical protein EGI88_15420 [Empedobacter falsenii]RRT86602.1 hypothetical protein EGI89_15405 [Empedobacter falsenii]